MVMKEYWNPDSKEYVKRLQLLISNSNIYTVNSFEVYGSSQDLIFYGCQINVSVFEPIFDVEHIYNISN